MTRHWQHSASRRRFLWMLSSVAASGVLSGCGRSDEGYPELDRALRDSGEAALARGTAYLWSRQAEGGGFGSDVYGMLRQGQSLTPFALESLLRVPTRLDPSDLRRNQRVAAALSSSLMLRDEDGALGFASSAPDYPCYATGLFLKCLGVARPKRWKSHAGASIDWLLSQQFQEAAGWSSHPAQGGWGMGSRTKLRPPHAGHVDLSMTRRVLQGLRAVGLPPDAPAFIEARAFVTRCRAANGAFVYSPVESGLNKGRRDPGPHATTGSGLAPSLGYGSATTDALLALEALGLAESRPGRDALAWLRHHHRVDRNPGIEGGPMAPFATAMRGYYRAGAARCFARFGGPTDWRPAMIEAIAGEQHDDGAWRNESPLQKEDDPLVATPFAVQALGDALGLSRA